LESEESPAVISLPFVFVGWPLISWDAKITDDKAMSLLTEGEVDDTATVTEAFSSVDAALMVELVRTRK
jgi:hypothetical protein